MTVTDRPNPLRNAQDRRLPRIAGPCVLVIFGVTGDLSRKKLMPAIYDLANRGLLPPGFSLVGFARREPAALERLKVAMGVQAEAVGFLGDGINDAPALHAADAEEALLHLARPLPRPASDAHRETGRAAPDSRDCNHRRVGSAW